MALFETGTINLSLKVMENDAEKQLTANVYMLEGVIVIGADGEQHLRQMSIGQLVMAVCLRRAAEMEAVVVGYMESISRNTATLEVLSEIESMYVNEDPDAGVNEKKTFSSKDGTNERTVWLSDGSKESSALPATILSALGVSVTTNDTYAEAISKIEAKMDSLNTMSQQTLIELQSATSKRDDTYMLITNVLKSMNQVIQGIVNNL